MVDFAWEQATIGSINSSNDSRESTCFKPMFTCLPPNDSASCRSHTSFVQEVLLGAEAHWQLQFAFNTNLFPARLVPPRSVRNLIIIAGIRRRRHSASGGEANSRRGIKSRSAFKVWSMSQHDPAPIRQWCYSYQDENAKLSNLTHI